MSDGSNPGATAKAAGGLTSENKDQEKALQTTQKAAQLEEDDEFEDFPVEGIVATYLFASWARDGATCANID